jgi:hypothetical protein
MPSDFHHYRIDSIHISSTDGIAFSFISYVLLSLVSVRARKLY